MIGIELAAEMFARFAMAGFFAVGGGLATLPFLYEMSSRTGWFTADDISNMIAISESTPGPMGVNMASYVGFLKEGVPGAVITTLGLIFPSLVIIMMVSTMLDRFQNSRLVQDIFYGLRPASMAMIAAAGMGVARIALLHPDLLQTGLLAAVNVKAVILAAVLFAAIKKFDFHPIIFIIASAAAGVMFRF